MTGTVLGPGNTAGSNKHKFLLLWSLHSGGRNKQDLKNWKI